MPAAPRTERPIYSTASRRIAGDRARSRRHRARRRGDRASADRSRARRPRCRTRRTDRRSGRARRTGAAAGARSPHAAAASASIATAPNQKLFRGSRISSVTIRSRIGRAWSRRPAAAKPRASSEIPARIGGASSVGVSSPVVTSHVRSCWYRSTNVCKVCRPAASCDAGAPADERGRVDRGLHLRARLAHEPADRAERGDPMAVERDRGGLGPPAHLVEVTVEVGRATAPQELVQEPSVVESSVDDHLGSGGIGADLAGQVEPGLGRAPLGQHVPQRQQRAAMLHRRVRVDESRQLVEMAVERPFVEIDPHVDGTAQQRDAQTPRPQACARVPRRRRARGARRDRARAHRPGESRRRAPRRATG